MPREPDVRFGHPCPPLSARRLRFAILASLAAEPGSRGTASPSLVLDCVRCWGSPERESTGDDAIRFEVVHETVAWFATLTRPQPEWQLTIRS